MRKPLIGGRIEEPVPFQMYKSFGTYSIHMTVRKSYCFLAYSSFPFLLLPVPSTVSQNLLPSPVRSHCPLAPRKTYDTDALIDMWWLISKGVMLVLKKAQRKYVIVFYLRQKEIKKIIKLLKTKSFFNLRLLNNELFPFQESAFYR